MTLKILLSASAAVILMSCSNPKKQAETTESRKSIQNPAPGQAKPQLKDSNTEIQGTVPEEKVSGDFNGDGRIEYAYLEAPETNDEMDCNGPCECTIRFSDTTIPVIKIPNCIGGLPDNLGDLNGDNADDIGLLPFWFTSCWTDYYSWTLKPGQWAKLVKPFQTHCNQWENNVKPIEKDPADPKKLVIRYSESEDSEIILKEKSIAID